jgi:hypothetical protein
MTRILVLWVLLIETQSACLADRSPKRNSLTEKQRQQGLRFEPESSIHTSDGIRV